MLGVLTRSKCGIGDATVLNTKSSCTFCLLMCLQKGVGRENSVQAREMFTGNVYKGSFMEIKNAK